MAKKDYFIPISNEDRIRVSRTLEKGELTQVTVQFECSYDGGETWYWVVRYDNFHGHLHRHIRNHKSDTQGRLTDHPLALREGMTYAILDIKASFERYRSQFDRKA